MNIRQLRADGWVETTLDRCVLGDSVMIHEHDDSYTVGSVLFILDGGTYVISISGTGEHRHYTGISPILRGPRPSLPLDNGTVVRIAVAQRSIVAIWHSGVFTDVSDLKTQYNPSRVKLTDIICGPDGVRVP